MSQDNPFQALAQFAEQLFGDVNHCYTTALAKRPTPTPKMPIAEREKQLRWLRSDALAVCRGTQPDGKQLVCAYCEACLRLLQWESTVTRPTEDEWRAMTRQVSPDVGPVAQQLSELGKQVKLCQQEILDLAAVWQPDQPSLVGESLTIRLEPPETEEVAKGVVATNEPSPNQPAAAPSQAEGATNTTVADQPTVELLSARDLAELLNQPPKRVGKFLGRLADKYPDCRTEVDCHRRSESHYLYRTAVVWPVLLKQLVRWCQ